MSPLSQGGVDGQELPIPQVLIGLCWGEATGQEGYRMNVLVLLRPLGEDGPDANIRGINLNYELMRGLRKDEHQGQGKQALEGRDCVLGLRGPGEGTEGRRQGGEWGCDPTETSDEATVEIGESEEAPELGTIRGSHSLLHHPYFLRVGPNLSLLQDVSQELHGGRVEHALLGLDEEPVLQQPLKDQTDVGGVFLGGPGEDQDVI